MRLQALDTRRFQGRIPIEPRVEAELPPSDAFPSAYWLRPAKSDSQNRDRIARALWDDAELQRDKHQVAQSTEAGISFAERYACTYARTCQPLERFREHIL